jgi:membrane-associated protein
VTSPTAASAALAALPALGPSWLDPSSLNTFGTAAIWIAAAIIFAECGLLIGFFLPGDTLLFTVGLLVGTRVVDLPLWAACVLLAIAALLGNAVGYEIGRAAGPAIFRRDDSALFKRENVERTAAFFDRWGAPAILLARFVPIVRTFITVTAGVARMDRRRYLLYSGLGAVIWAGGVTVGGYFLGSIPFVRNNVSTIFAIVEVVLVLVVLMSVAPILIDVWRRRRRRTRQAAGSDPVPPAGGQGSRVPGSPPGSGPGSNPRSARP